VSLQKILVVNTKYRVFGGEDANIVDELRFLKNYFEVDYLEYNNADKIGFSDLIGFFAQSNPISNSRLLEKIKIFKPDIVYIHNTWYKAGLGIFKICKKRNIKILHKIHNYRFDCSRFFLSKNHLKHNQQCPACGIKKENLGKYNKYFSESIIKSFIINFYSKKYFRILKSYPIKILVLSEFQKNYIKKLGIDNDKISIYSNPIGISLEDFSQYNPESNSVIFAGRLVENKGIEEILQIWKNIDTNNLILEIIGTTEDKNNLFKKYNSKKIKFLGQLDNSEVKRKIKTSRAVITATKLFEGQPRVLLEASSYGVPSIYPNFGGMSDFFPSDYMLSFIQFNYEDLEKKILMLNDSKLLSDESKSIKKHLIENFTEELLFARFENILKKDENE
tara:strand:- start:10167 stop:11339 length:1173 start_codon:yes stop_codon:yes gene_type:complete